MTFQNLIIGSGPTAIVAAMEILKSDKQVCIVDIGNKIEDNNFNIKKSFLENFDIETFIRSCKEKLNIKYLYKNDHLKFPLGSDFVYRKTDFEIFNASTKVDYVLSNAEGGLSNIWGTMVSPFFPKDIKDWDISYSHFYKEYKKIEKIIPILSSRDNLDNFFPINYGQPHNFALSPNAADFYSELNKNSNEYNKNGIFFGRAKLAIGNMYSYNQVQCQSCGLCHYGCPYDCMFNSSQILAKISQNKNFTYINKSFVKEITLNNQGNINAHIIDIANNKKNIIIGKNIFICCGPISTAALLLRSKLTKSSTIYFKESQRFILPILKKKNFKNSINQNKNTLSEIFLEIYNNLISDKTIHIQYYAFLNEMLKPLEKLFGSYSFYLPKFFPSIFGRLNLLIGYLHSDYSNQLSFTMDRDKKNFYLDEVKNKKTEETLNKILKFINVKFKNNFFILNFLKNINLTGASYHYGSSFPMKKNQGNKDSTTLLGELNGNKNIFLLDASILPDVPASPTTLNVCINARRIISELNDLKRL
jgi:choline dehydrogenase-like flavoprotein